MKKILMFVFNDLSKDARVLRSIRALDDYDVTVISYGNSNFKKSGFKNIEIKKNKSKSNMLNYVTYLKESFKYIKEGNFDIIYAHDYYCCILNIFYKIFKKKKYFIYDAHELFIVEKYFKHSIRENLFYFFEKKAIKNTDLLICAEEKRAEVMMKHYKLKKKPLVIKNISYLPKCKEMKDKEIENKFNNLINNGNLNLVYAGVLSKDRKIEYIVDQVSTIKEKINLIIIGYGEQEKIIQNKVGKNENMVSLGAINYNELSSILEKCDIGIMSYPSDCLNNIYCAPNKLYEYASVGLPIICLENYNIKKIVNKYRIGYCGDDLKKGVEQITNNIEYYKRNINYFLEDNLWIDEEEKLKKALKIFNN